MHREYGCEQRSAVAQKSKFGSKVAKIICKAWIDSIKPLVILNEVGIFSYTAHLDLLGQRSNKPKFHRKVSCDVMHREKKVYLNVIFKRQPFLYSNTEH